VGLLEVKDRVQRYLIGMDLHGIEVIESGFTFRSGSTRLFIRVLEYGESDDSYTAIHFSVPVVLDLKPSPELFEYVARHSDDKVFGHMGLDDEADGTLTLTFNHTLLGDYLDPPELERTVYAVAGTSDSIDNDLASRFGGRVFHED
jgi:hypothetical protein